MPARPEMIRAGQDKPCKPGPDRPALPQDRYEVPPTQSGGPKRCISRPKSRRHSRLQRAPAAPSGSNGQREATPHAPSRSLKGTANLKAPGGKAAAAAPSRTSASNVRRRPSTQPKPRGTANPKAPRRQSRRSSTRQGKRTNARHRPSTQPKPKWHSHTQSAPAA